MARGQETAATGAAVPGTRRPTRTVRWPSSGHVLMIVAAVAAMALNYSVLRQSQAQAEVLVAREALAAGTVLAPEHLRTAPISSDSPLLPSLVAAGRLAELEGSRLVTALAAGEPLRAGDVRPEAAPGGLRAMSVPVAPEHAVAGALEAGDRVDVIEVRDDVARYLLVGAEVLAVPDAERRGGLGSITAFSVTLAVDDAAALELALAIRGGAVEVVRATGAAPPSRRTASREEAVDDPGPSSGPPSSPPAEPTGEDGRG